MTLNHLTHSTYLANVSSVDSVNRDSAKLRGLRVWLYDFQSGKCFDCGNTMSGYGDDDSVNMCHMVGGQMSGFGYMPGNVALAHRRCNVLQHEAFGTVIPWRYLETRVTRIANTWPDRMTLVTLGNEASSDRRNDDANRVSDMRASCE